MMGGLEENGEVQESLTVPFAVIFAHAGTGEQWKLSCLIISMVFIHEKRTS